MCIRDSLNAGYGVLVDFADVEFLFERHDDFHHIKRIGVQIALERRFHRHLILVNRKLVADNAANFLKHLSLIHI